MANESTRGPRPPVRSEGDAEFQTPFSVASAGAAPHPHIEYEAILVALHDIAADPQLDFNDKVHRLLAAGCNYLQLELGIFSRVDGNDYEIVGVYPSDDRVQAGDRLRLDHTFCALTLQATAPVGFHHASRGEWKRHPAYQKLFLEAYLGAPVRVKNELYGTLNFSSATAHSRPFDDGEFAVVRLMAQWIGFELTRVRAEDALAQSRRKLQLVTDSVPAMISYIDHHERYRFANRAYEDWFDVSRDEIIGNHMADVLGQDLYRQITRHVQRALAGHRETYEQTIPNRRGELRDVEVNFVPDLEVTGRTKGFFVIVFDITRLKRVEDSLRSHDDALRRLLEASGSLSLERDLDKLLQKIVDSAREILDCEYAAVGILDEDGRALRRFIYAGIDAETARLVGHFPTGRGLLGLPIAEARPYRVDDVHGHPRSVGFPNHHPPMSTFLGVPLLGPDRPIGNLYCTDKRGGQTFSGADEEFAQRLATHAVIAVQNAELIAQLRTLHASRSRFYAMMNHELRNALTGVQGWSELFLRKNPDSRMARETHESSEYSVQLLNDMLDLSRLEADQMEIKIGPTDALKIAEDARRTVAPLADDAGVTLVLECPEKDIPCQTDGRRVQQILVNLIRNAVQHSPTGGTVTCRLEIKEDAAIMFAVIDCGEGIPPGQLAIIFDAFKRADSKSGGGTGLGLTVSKKLAQLMGGDLTVTSQLGEGAIFAFTIPSELEESATR